MFVLVGELLAVQGVAAVEGRVVGGEGGRAGGVLLETGEAVREAGDVGAAVFEGGAGGGEGGGEGRAARGAAVVVGTEGGEEVRETEEEEVDGAWMGEGGEEQGKEGGAVGNAM